MSRRAFLRCIGLGLAAPTLGAGLGPVGRALAQGVPHAPLAGQGEAGTLHNPGIAGRSRQPTDPRDNDAAIKRIEQGLRCTCGCNLDIYTCRTTDFTCTYSPELHREVVALYESGQTAEQIVAAFVAKYGETARMAPPPTGAFNLTGYLLPGALIALAGAGLVAFIGRWGRVAAAPQESGAAGQPGSGGATASRIGADEQAGDPSRAEGRRSVTLLPSQPVGIAPAVPASPRELEQLQRELAEVDD